jgi:hypothetical protein
MSSTGTPHSWAWDAVTTVNIKSRAKPIKRFTFFSEKYLPLYSNALPRQCGRNKGATAEEKTLSTYLIASAMRMDCSDSIDLQEKGYRAPSRSIRKYTSIFMFLSESRSNRRSEFLFRTASIV